MKKGQYIKKNIFLVLKYDPYKNNISFNNNKLNKIKFNYYFFITIINFIILLSTKNKKIINI